MLRRPKATLTIWKRSLGEVLDPFRCTGRPIQQRSAEIGPQDRYFPSTRPLIRDRQVTRAGAHVENGPVIEPGHDALDGPRPPGAIDIEAEEVITKVVV